MHLCFLKCSSFFGYNDAVTQNKMWIKCYKKLSSMTQLITDLIFFNLFVKRLTFMTISVKINRAPSSKRSKLCIHIDFLTFKHTNREGVKGYLFRELQGLWERNMKNMVSRCAWKALWSRTQVYLAPRGDTQESFR